MSHAYIVIATDGPKVENCEAYAGVQSALGRAFQLASDKVGHGGVDRINASPNEEQMSDGSVRWVFVSDDKQSVAVHYRKIEESLLSIKDPAVATPPHPFIPFIQVASAAWVAPPAAHIHTTSDYDFNNPSLPVGWKVDGHPAFMSDMIDDPLSVKDPADLTEDQKDALVIVRISKSPNWVGTAKGSASPIPWRQVSALNQIKAGTGIGQLLRDKEIEMLHNQRETLLTSRMFNEGL